LANFITNAGCVKQSFVSIGRENSGVILARKLYIGNLPFNTTQIQLRELLSKAGEVTDIYLSKNRFTSKSSGFAFVEMASESAAVKAVELFHGHRISERSLTVQAIDPASSSEWKGTLNTVVLRKSPPEAEASQNDDGKS